MAEILLELAEAELPPGPQVLSSGVHATSDRKRRGRTGLELEADATGGPRSSLPPADTSPEIDPGERAINN
jgi:hypothetical protein